MVGIPQSHPPLVSCPPLCLSPSRLPFFLRCQWQWHESCLDSPSDLAVVFCRLQQSWDENLMWCVFRRFEMMCKYFNSGHRIPFITISLCPFLLFYLFPLLSASHSSKIYLITPIEKKMLISKEQFPLLISNSFSPLIQENRNIQSNLVYKMIPHNFNPFKVLMEIITVWFILTRGGKNCKNNSLLKMF